MSADVLEQARPGAETNGDHVTEELPKVNGSSGNLQDAGNKFQQAISTWRNLNLSGLVSTLDKAASQIVEDQKETVAQRKELAQKTKDFRKLDDAGKLSDIKGLLKSYQNFIDLITNQSKGVNSAFLSAYTPLSEAPDPYPLLEASVESLVTSEDLVPRLESENAHLQRTTTKLTNQIEDLEQQLEKERSSRQTSENTQDYRIKEIEESWDAALKEKEENWAAKESSLEEKVENQDRLLKELKASYEVSQRLEKAGGADNAASARKAANAEIEILSSELEKSTLRLTELEARNEQLRVDLAQSTSKAGSSHKTAVEDDPAFLRLRSENTALMRKLDSSKYERDSDQSKLESRIKSLERDLSSVKDDREGLQSKLSRYSDYDEIKQELEMIRTIEFATGDDEEEDPSEPSTTHANGTANSKTESLEQLLLTRNKKLNDELTTLRLSSKTLESQFSTLQETLSTTNMDLEKTRQLNAQLENELLEAQQTVSNFDNLSVAGTYTSRYPKSSYGTSRRGTATSPTSSIISGFDGRSSPGGPSPISGVGGGSGILPMVTAQRDRFKKKLSDLESELQKSHATVSSLRSEIASLQRDNLSLYEKSRYVNSYARAGGSPIGPNGVAVSGSDATSSGLSLDRYKSAYESGLSPFAAFRGRESARAYRRMSVPERGVYAVARTVLATRTSRNLFALYCVALHLLVFYSLYAMGSVGSAKVAAGVVQGYKTAGGGGLKAGGEWEQAGLQDGKPS